MPTRVCVLVSSYEDSTSEMKEFEGHLIQTPQNFFDCNDPDYCFSLAHIKKATAYRQIRQLVEEGNFDVFYNQCDGAMDEDRAGIEVVQALESFGVPFTGATSKYYEPSKPTMKMVAFYSGIETAPHAVLSKDDSVREVCATLRFPLIVKHVSGYSSVGMDKSSKVSTMEELEERVQRFIEVYQHALVEEFITGDEATILVCADSSEPDGVRVFHPVQVSFPEGEDFKHFQLKWESYEGMMWHRVSHDDPALPAMLNLTRKAFKTMLGGVGYGRVDVRIDRNDNNRVVFLEINPNCGIMYPYGEEGSADWVLRLTPDFKQRDFAMLQIREAVGRCARERVRYTTAYDPVRKYHLRATEDVPCGSIVICDEGKQVRLRSRASMKSDVMLGLPQLTAADLGFWGTPHKNGSTNGHAKESREKQVLPSDVAWPLGKLGEYSLVWDSDPAVWRCINHSGTPTMRLDPAGTLSTVAARDIRKGEELTIDYSTLLGDSHSQPPPFDICLSDRAARF